MASKKQNGKRRIKRRGNRDDTIEARARVLKVVKARGIISSREAGKIGKWGQSWFHLHAMVQAGQLEHAGYNQWMLPKPKKRKPLKAGSAKTRAEAR